MANWSNNPVYTELDQIMSEEATRKIGLTAEQFNKVMYNIAYLKKLYGLYKCELGTVTVNYAAPGTDFDVDITHRQAVVGGVMTDFLDFTFTVAVARITASVVTEQVEPTADAEVSVTPTRLSDDTGYNMGFKFKMPRTKTNCVDRTDTGEVLCVLQSEEDTSFTATGVTRLTIQIPETARHGFFAGVNIKIGDTPPQIVFSNFTDYPLKLMKRGVVTSGYEYTPNKTEMLVFLCDGINMCCNLIEV